MVIGRGDIASILPDNNNLLFFASGVSNSQTAKEADYDREYNLLLAQNTDNHIVYFSSLALFNDHQENTPYINHKHEMEMMIKRKFSKHTIIRLGNIDWGKNPHTFINYLKAHPEAEIRDEWRYVVDKDEFLYWINLIPPWTCEMSIPGRRMKVQEVYNEYIRIPTR